MTATLLKHVAVKTQRFSKKVDPEIFVQTFLGGSTPVTSPLPSEYGPGLNNHQRPAVLIFGLNESVIFHYIHAYIRAQSRADTWDFRKERFLRKKTKSGTWYWYSAACISQTRGQKRFTISEVAAHWHELMIPQRIMRPSIARASEQMDPRCNQQTYHPPDHPINHWIFYLSWNYKITEIVNF